MNSFQEFSQRYAVANQGFEPVEARMQDTKNRQNSLLAQPEAQIWLDDCVHDLNLQAQEVYREALERGIAKECARFVLPLSTRTRLYMKGSVRSWIHYLSVRCAPETQKEHRDLAEACRAIFVEQFPITSAALEWK